MPASALREAGAPPSMPYHDRHYTVTRDDVIMAISTMIWALTYADDIPLRPTPSLSQQER